MAGQLDKILQNFLFIYLSIWQVGWACAGGGCTTVKNLVLHGLVDLNKM
jgi:hypothetical protein